MEMEKSTRKKIMVSDIALIGMMVAALEVGKMALAALPNIEIVSFFIILFTLLFGKKSIYAVIIFVFLECFIWGFGLWTIMYLYIWPLYTLVTYKFRRMKSIWFWCIYSAIFGLMYGGLCSLVYLPMGGLRTAFAWWIAGIPWDVAHGAGNFVVMLVLYHPLQKVFNYVGRSLPVK